MHFIAGFGPINESKIKHCVVKHCDHYVTLTRLRSRLQFQSIDMYRRARVFKKYTTAKQIAGGAYILSAAVPVLTAYRLDLFLLKNNLDFKLFFVFYIILSCINKAYKCTFENDK